MKTLIELKAAIMSDDLNVRGEALKTITDLWEVYDREKETVEDIIKRGNAESDRVTAGVNVPKMLDLKSLILSSELRLIHLKEKQTAFKNSTLSIVPPSPSVITNVKNLSEKVAKLQMKTDTASQFLKLLTKLAKETAQVYGS